VEHPVRNFFIVAALIAGSVLLVNFAADTLEQVETRKHSIDEQANTPP
jgi:hypothetical protein